MRAGFGENRLVQGVLGVQAGQTFPPSHKGLQGPWWPMEGNAVGRDAQAK